MQDIATLGFEGIVLEGDEGTHISQALGKKKAVLLLNHGLLTTANTVEGAVFWIDSLTLSIQRCGTCSMVKLPRPSSSTASLQLITNNFCYLSFIIASSICMPRITPALIRQVNKLDSLLARLLPICRGLNSAQNELRWLREHVAEIQHQSSKHDQRSLLSQLVLQRARGEPLQYIIGNEYFGDLNLRCRPGVLIPRQETAASITCLVERAQKHFAHLRKGNGSAELRVLDLCTGSGCIPLLFQHEFINNCPAVKLDCVGVDISTQALSLAEENRKLQLAESLSRKDHASVAALQCVQFLQADIFNTENMKNVQAALKTDILISNPPYISRQQFRTITARSVRKYEPRLALVPEQNMASSTEDGDQFYPRLWQVAEECQQDDSIRDWRHGTSD
ncbi:hypothetical protein MRB53_039355 [Persea americana]|nr:hypothetical protein MRB53_039355 [Persea americana]